ncbi:RHS repeat-associated core domain-containing protein, partial [Sphingobacterium phlebotomi]
QDHLQNVTTWYVDGNVYQGSQLIEQPIPSGIYYRQANVYHYQLTDHVGSVRAIINRNKLSSGNADIIYYADYYPFGSIIQSAGIPSRYGYQGEYSEKDGETGWNNFYLRNYDPAIGRWLSTDPYGQYWSPYVGMGNNPVMRFDPDGGQDGGGLWGWLKGVFGNGYPAGHEKNPIAIDEVVVTAYKMPSWQDVGQNRTTISASSPFLNLTSQSHRQSMYNYQQILANANYNDISNPATALAIGQNVANFAGGEVVLARSLSFLKAAKGGIQAESKVFLVTNEGVVLPKGAKIPDEFVVNPFRSSNYGIIENGKFIEKLRIDPPTPINMKGPNVSHFHLDGGKEHIFDISRWPWW